jgi:hypothetical protein
MFFAINVIKSIYNKSQDLKLEIMKLDTQIKCKQIIQDDLIQYLHTSDNPEYIEWIETIHPECKGKVDDRYYLPNSAHLLIWNASEMVPKDKKLKTTKYYYFPSYFITLFAVMVIVPIIFILLTTRSTMPVIVPFLYGNLVVLKKNFS